MFNCNDFSQSLFRFFFSYLWLIIKAPALHTSPFFFVFCVCVLCEVSGRHCIVIVLCVAVGGFLCGLWCWLIHLCVAAGFIKIDVSTSLSRATPR